MNRRQLFKRVAASVALVTLKPIIPILPEGPIAEVRSYAAHGVSLATYDEILKKVYGPMIMRELVERGSLMMMLSKKVDGTKFVVPVHPKTEWIDDDRTI